MTNNGYSKLYSQQTIEFKNRLKEKYKNLPQKCIADEIWLYCRYLYDNIDGMVQKYYTVNGVNDNQVITKETKQQFYDKLHSLYQDIRGEIFYQGKKPASYAGGIFYITSVLCGLYLTQPIICEKLHISITGMRHAYQDLQKYYNRNEKKWPY